MSVEPSPFATRPERSLTLYLCAELATMRRFAPAIVIDQNALTGGRPPSGKRMTYDFEPSSLAPLPSTVACQYIASLGGLIAGRVRAQAASVIRSLGTPQAWVVCQPLTVVVKVDVRTTIRVA